MFLCFSTHRIRVLITVHTIIPHRNKINHRCRFFAIVSQLLNYIVDIGGFVFSAANKCRGTVFFSPNLLTVIFLIDIILLLWRCNSDGQSSRFIPDLSLVRIQSPLPKIDPPARSGDRFLCVLKDWIRTVAVRMVLSQFNITSVEYSSGGVVFSRTLISSLMAFIFSWMSKRIPGSGP